MAFALLGKLLDIEWLLARDAQRPSAELERHDRELLGPDAPASPEQAIEPWLAARRRELGGRTPGRRSAELLSALHVALVALALAGGAGTAGALLRGAAGRAPTDVLSFLFATLIWPLALLVGSVGMLGLRGRLARSLLLEDLYALGVGVLGRLSRRAPEQGELASQWRTLRRSERRYRDLEVAMLLSAAQWYPVAFHAGAALTLTASALFSDLAFAWSTTNDSLDPSTLGAVFRVATAPWCSTLGVGCISPELVRATQFSRFTGQYASPQGAAMSGAWWPALLGCLVCYGVLPRLSFSLGLRALVWRRSARLGERVHELRSRFGGVTVRVSEPHTAPAVAAPAPARAAAPAGRELPCWVIGWRGAALGDAELGATCARLGLRAERRDAAGDGDYESDRAILRAGSSLAAALLVVDGWEAPDKATRHFIQALRAVGVRPLFVGVLLEANDAPNLAIWRDRVGLLEDPDVNVEAIIRKPNAELEARP